MDGVVGDEYGVVGGVVVDVIVECEEGNNGYGDLFMVVDVG